MAKKRRKEEELAGVARERHVESRGVKRLKQENASEKKHEQYSWDKMREFEPSLFDKNESNKEEEKFGTSTDEFRDIFNGEKEPKMLITTAPRPKKVIFSLVGELMSLFPNLFFYKREKFALRDICKWAFKRGFTHVLVLTERLKKPFQLMVCFNGGPTALFKVLSFKKAKEIRKRGKKSDHLPEVLLNNFSTPLGNRIGRVIGSLFAHKQDADDFVGRNVVTFHNQRDYIFVRCHRYVFNDSFDKVDLQELGPRFTLKMIWLMNGTFDTQHSEFEFIYKRKEMRSKTKYFL